MRCVPLQASGRTPPAKRTYPRTPCVTLVMAMMAIRGHVDDITYDHSRGEPAGSCTHTV
jgi:hypothetical protein